MDITDKNCYACKHSYAFHRNVQNNNEFPFNNSKTNFPQSNNLVNEMNNYANSLNEITMYLCLLPKFLKYQHKKTLHF